MILCPHLRAAAWPCPGRGCSARCRCSWSAAPRWPAPGTGCAPSDPRQPAVGACSNLILNVCLQFNSINQFNILIIWMVKLLDPLRVIFWIDLIVVTLYAAPGRNYWEHHFSFLIIERYCDFLPLNTCFWAWHKINIVCTGSFSKDFFSQGAEN